jgi:hypothetical protein
MTRADVTRASIARAGMMVRLLVKGGRENQTSIAIAPKSVSNTASGRTAAHAQENPTSVLLSSVVRACVLKPKPMTFVLFVPSARCSRPHV